MGLVRLGLYDVLYEGATADATSDDMRFCTDDAIGPLSPYTTWFGAGLGGDEWNDYWDERYHLQDVIDNSMAAYISFGVYKIGMLIHIMHFRLINY